MKVVRITAKPAAGFRRCGVHHPASDVDHPSGRFTAAELAILKAEPRLVVQEIDVAEPTPEPEPEPAQEPEPAPAGAAGEPAAAPPPDPKPVSGAGKGGKTKKNA